MDKLDKIYQERLEKNLRIIAEVIVNGGTKYWDVYYRIESELSETKKRRKKLKKILKHLE